MNETHLDLPQEQSDQLDRREVPSDLPLTGTGLDRLVTTVYADQGLTLRLDDAEVRTAAEAMTGMNAILIEALEATGGGRDGVITASDVYALSDWIQENRSEDWVRYHGDDEAGVETGFHLVQNDGASTFLFGENAINNVADGLYHVGLGYDRDRLINEDGNRNAQVDDVAFWMNSLLQDELSSGRFAGPEPDPIATTGTGLDRLVELILSDEGLQDRIPQSEIEAGAAAANTMNQIIVDSIRELGLANDGALSAGDVFGLADHIKTHYAEAFMAAHGDDEGNVETGFHLVQNDGALATLFGDNAVNTVADGIYHLVFGYEGGNLINEDGNRNARVEEVAYWLNDLLKEDLNGLANPDVDPRPSGTTGTGLDQLVEIINEDAGLQSRLPLAEQNAGAAAANAMNEIIVDGIRELGLARDGSLSVADVTRLADHIQANHAEAFMAAHGDDEGNVETGFHLVQNDGALTELYGRNAVNTVADGLYHLVFGYEGDRLINEDGNRNVRLEEATDWLNRLLADDLAEWAEPDTSPAPEGLDQIVSLIGADQELNRRLSASEIEEGQAVAQVMNDIILEAVQATGAGSNGRLSAGDVAMISDWIVENRQAAWIEAHGDDEAGVETGFHLVQNDGAISQLYGNNAVNTVADGIYHLGFGHNGQNLINEDGNRNASLTDVAFWLEDLLGDQLSSGALAGETDPYEVGSTGTGLDALPDLLMQDAGLETRFSTTDLRQAAEAADGLNRILLDAIRETGSANDGKITGADVARIDAWIAENAKAEWDALNGADSRDADGYRMIQFEGGVSQLAGMAALDGAGRLLYSLGNGLRYDNVYDADGRYVGRVEEAANVLNRLLYNDMSGLENPDAFGDLSATAVISARAAVQTEGTGLTGHAFDTDRGWSDVQTMIDAIEAGTLQATHEFETGAISFAGSGTESLASFLGADSEILSGDGATEMRTIGMQLTGYVWLDPGEHEITVRSDDGFAMRLGGEELMRFAAPRGDAPTTETVTVGGGLYEVEIFYYENYGGQSLSLWVDGEVLDKSRLYQSVEAFEAAAPYAPDAGPVITADQAEQREGTGLRGEVYGDTPYLNDVQKLIAGVESGTMAVTHEVRVDTLEMRGRGSESLDAFLGENGEVMSGDAGMGMERVGVHLTGYIWIDPGEHVLSVRSDDGFALRIGGEDLIRYATPRGESASEHVGTFEGGLYEIEIFYYENGGNQALQLLLDDETVGSDRLYGSVEEFEAAAPYVPVETGPELTGTGLDAIIGWINEDPGLALRVSDEDLAAGAEAATQMNGIILDGIRALGLADDGALTGSEVHDLANWINENRYADWMVAHGDDEAGVETGFHLVQNDGGRTQAFGDRAIDTVADGLYHLGFGADGDRLLNEDGNRNARVEDVAFWLNELLEQDLANGSLVSGAAQSVEGSTGTGLDRIVTEIQSDPELLRRLPGQEIRDGAAAADVMNAIIVEGVMANGYANDGVITGAEVAGLADWVKETHYETWLEAHGDDEAGVETGFHLVQNDGAVTRDYTQNLINTVADGIYHLGFGHDGRNLINEDGNRNASLNDVGYWLTDLLADDMTALANPDVDPVLRGSTGTGLDQLVTGIGEDAGLQGRITLEEIRDGAAAADVMNAIIVEGIRENGYANDGQLTNAEVMGLADWIRETHLDAWLEAHGDDEAGVETGFHLVQNDGADARIFAENLVNTIADGIYHLGFGYRGDRLINEDGNNNQRVSDIASWMNQLLSEDDFAFLSNPEVETLTGSTGTGLDAWVTAIMTDAGLQQRVSLSEIEAGAAAADAMNTIIVDSIIALGIARDGAFSESDIRALSEHIRENHLDAWLEAHGDDETGVETGFHLVQNDGAQATVYGENAINTVMDGAYHLGFGYQNDRLINEDGDRNQRLADVAYWLEAALADELRSGALVTEESADPYLSGSTGTGLDLLVQMITQDTILNQRLSLSEIRTAAEAADALNGLLLEGVRETGIAANGRITEVDLKDLSDWLVETHAEEWRALNEDFVKAWQADSVLFDVSGVRDVADALYNLGFGYHDWGSVMTETGGSDQRLSAVASWLNTLLAEEMGTAAVLPAGEVLLPEALVSLTDLSGPETVMTPEAGLTEAALVVSFTANSPESGRDVLISQDYSGRAEGEFTLSILNGQLELRVEDAGRTYVLRSDDVRVQAGETYTAAVNIGADQVELFLNGQKVDLERNLDLTLSENLREMVAGGGTWSRGSWNETRLTDLFDGEIHAVDVYGQTLDNRQVAALNTSGDLPVLRVSADLVGPMGEGDGLNLAVHDLDQGLSNVTQLKGLIEGRDADASGLVGGLEFSGGQTVAEFLGGEALAGTQALEAETFGLEADGFVFLEAGTHRFDVRSDDGFRLSLGGEVVVDFEGLRGAATSTAWFEAEETGYYALDLLYFENGGAQVLDVDLDGRDLDSAALFSTLDPAADSFLF
jgi:hypothetical protein